MTITVELVCVYLKQNKRFEPWNSVTKYFPNLWQIPFPSHKLCSANQDLL